ncbi:hypothetical protein [Nostoc sp.]
MPLQRGLFIESKRDNCSRSVYFSTSDRSAFTRGILPSTQEKCTTEG